MRDARSGFASLAALAFALLVSEEPALATVKISAKTTQNMSCSSGICSPTAKNAVLNVTALAGMLGSGDVTVKSDSVAQDIETDAPLSWASGNRLTMDSHRSITFNHPISVTGPGAITIATNDGGLGGDLRFLGNGHLRFWDKGSKLTINGNGYALAMSIRAISRLSNPKLHNCHIALGRGVDAMRTPYAASPIPEFNGTLEGLGNTISNLTIKDPISIYGVGLIGTLAGSGCSNTNAVRDLRLESANIVGNGGQRTGALVGLSEFAEISNIEITGSVTNGVSASVGGLLGDSAATNVTRVRSSATVSVGANGFAGGLVGTNEGFTGFGVLSESYSTGNVSGGDNAEVGGLIGDNAGGTVSQSYAFGSATGGNNSFSGGLIGVSEEGTGFPLTEESYSIGAVSGGSGATLGGIVGKDIGGSSNSNVYWDLDTSGIANPHQGAGNIPDDPGITGLTDAQLKSGLPAGFSGKIWKQNPKINNGYPYLTFNPSQ